MGLGQLAALLKHLFDILSDEVRFKIDSIVDLHKTEHRQLWIGALMQHAAGYASQFLAQSYVGPLADQTLLEVRSRDPMTFPNTD